MSTITVSNLAELYTALGGSKAGDTILLNSGNYESFILGSQSGMDLDFEGVTIASADPDNPASFSKMVLNGVSNLVMDNVVFDYSFQAGDASFLAAFSVKNSENITIKNSVFDGDVASGVSDVADGYGYAYGLTVRDSSGISIENNEFTSWLRGAIFSNIDGLTVTGNEVHDIRSDGMDFADVQNVLITDNYFHDFRASYASTDHRDMIQFWTNGTSDPSVNITISDNIFDIGNGSRTQSIFMRNEEVDTGRAGFEMYYQNVTITNNTIYNSHLHGISIGETNGLVISNNSVIFVPDQNDSSVTNSSLWVPAIRVSSSSVNVDILGNAVAKIVGFTDQSSWVLGNNVLIQNTNPHGAGYYGDVFISSSMSTVDGSHAYIAIPGGALDTSGAGSSETLVDLDLDVSAFYMTSNKGGQVTFDASLTVELLGIEDGGASYVWTFGDGTTSQGKIVNHAYSGPDNYDVTLTVTTTTGRVLTAASVMNINGSQVLSYDAGTTSFIAYNTGVATNLGAVTSVEGDAIHLGASGTSVSVPRTSLTAVRGVDDFTIDFALKADTAGAAGEIFRMHGSFWAIVNAAGNLVVQLQGQNGSLVKLTTSGPSINDGSRHDLSISLSDGKLSLLIDGDVAAEAAFTDILPTTGSWNLVFGNPWGSANFAGELSSFEMSVLDGNYAKPPFSTVVTADSAMTSQSDTDNDAALSRGSVQDGDPQDGLSDADSGADDDADGTDTAASHQATASTSDGDADGVSDGTSGTTSDTTSGAASAGSDDGGDRLALSVTFARNDSTDASADDNPAEGGGEDQGTENLLLSNPDKFALILTDDGLKVQLATADQGLVAFVLDDLGLDDAENHNITVLLDAQEDHLQVLLDGNLVLNIDDSTHDFLGDWGQNQDQDMDWDQYFSGEVSVLRLIEGYDMADPGLYTGLTLA